MCNALAEGGRRCPIHRNDTMVAVNLAVQESGLSRTQVENVFTELRREGRGEGRAAADTSEWTEYLRELRDTAERVDPSGRVGSGLQGAFDGDVNAPDRSTFYALRRIRDRVATRTAAVDRQLQTIAESQNRDPGQVRAEYEAALRAVDTRRGAEVPDSYTASAVEDAQAHNLPSDRASVVALQRVRAVERSEERRVQLEDVESETFSQAGYDRSSGRMEVVYKDQPDTVYPYRDVPEPVWQEFSENYDAAALSTVIGNSDHQYASASEAEAESRLPRCANCGQFRSGSHTCPARTRVVEVEPATSASTHNPLDDPDQIIPGVRRINFTDVSEAAVPTSVVSQRYPEPIEAQVEQQITASKSDLGVENYKRFYVLRKARLLEQIEQYPNLDPADVEKVRNAPEKTVFAVNNMAWVSRRYAFATMSTVREEPADQAELRAAVTNLDIVATYDEREVKLESRDYSTETIVWRSKGEGRIPSLPSITAEQAEERETQAHDTLEAKVAADEAVLVGQNVTSSRKYTMDGSLDTQPQIRFAKVTNYRQALTSGKVAVAPLEFSVPRDEAWNNAKIDDQGYRRPQVEANSYYQNSAYMVTGNVGMKRNAQTKVVELDESTTHLKCQCPDYAANYHCEHVDYVKRHMPNVGQQMLPMRPRHRALTNELSKIRNIEVAQRPDGSDVISLRNRKTTTSRKGSAEIRSAIPVTLPEGVNHASMSAEQLHEAMESHRAALSIDVVQTINKPGSFYKAVAHGNTEIPVRMEFAREGSHTPVVEGGVIYHKTEDQNDLQVASHDLKCSCADYAENYDCKHVRTASENAHLSLARTSVGAVTLASLQAENQADMKAEQRIQRELFLNPDQDMDELRERIAEEERERERQRVAEVRRQQLARFSRDASLLQQRRDRLSSSSRQREEEAEREYVAYRDAMLARHEEREPGYTNDPEKFFNEFQANRQNREFEFRVESGVLDGSASGPGARKFGVELEFVMDDMDYDDQREALNNIARDLHREGLTDSPRQTGYHSGASNGWAKWSFEHDGTVDGEIVSPLLSDDEESWRQLGKVCEIAKRHGATVNSQAGSHVHVSTGSYGFSTSKHGELARTITQNEDLMYRLAANPHTGNHRGTQWCRPNTVDSEDDLPQDIQAGISVFSTDHAHMLNYAAAGNPEHRKSHTEFRMWDGTLDPGVIQRQVMVSMALADHAERQVLKEGASKKPTEPRKKRGDHKNDEARILSEAGRSTHDAETFMATNAKAAQFMDTLFRRHSDRQAVMQLFAVNKWQRG